MSEQLQDLIEQLQDLIERLQDLIEQLQDLIEQLQDLIEQLHDLIEQSHKTGKIHTKMKTVIVGSVLSYCIINLCNDSMIDIQSWLMIFGSSSNYQL